ncbi:MAG: hypothetical protein COT17_03805 [Elusimicrobia bacterium CG08_land_8_20_14_0_20_51_18]|nr:MAG: hypothetical protein COT17_03805 [Elusimicrobia bacterium CG08_land_8_20_14_0_20_51_18]
MANPDIIIVDDDPMVGELSRDLLTDAGWNVMLVQDSLQAIEIIRQNMPRLVISDIMMPGITGMDICKHIKTDPDMKRIKVMIVSGKSYDVEKQRAFQLGADFFLQKPYNVETFSETVKSILEGVAQNSPPPAAPIRASLETDDEKEPQLNDLAKDQLRLTIYGAKALPSVFPNSPSKYGRQTMCASLETHENIFIFDAGTGIVELGKEIVSKKRYYKDIWLFLSHFHLENIMGLPHFEPIHDPRFSIHIVGPNDPEKTLKEVVRSNFYSSFSPVRSAPKAKIDLYEILEDNYELMPGLKLSTMYSNHPTTTMLYFMEFNGFKVGYAPDSEIWGDATALQDYDERLGKFTNGFNVLIHDTYYNDEDYEKLAKKGHSGLTITTEFAIKNEIQNLVLFNLNPEYSDETLEGMAAKAASVIQKENAPLKSILAQERQQFIYKI